MNTYTHGSSLYLTYYPLYLSLPVPYSYASRDVTAYKIDVMTFNKQVVIIPMLDVWYTDSTGTQLNNSKINTISSVGLLLGELAITSDNSVVNAAQEKLFSVKVEFDVTLYNRL